MGGCVHLKFLGNAYMHNWIEWGHSFDATTLPVFQKFVLGSLIQTLPENSNYAATKWPNAECRNVKVGIYLLGWVITITTLTNLWKNVNQLPCLYLVHIKPLY